MSKLILTININNSDEKTELEEFLYDIMTLKFPNNEFKISNIEPIELFKDIFNLNYIEDNKYPNIKIEKYPNYLNNKEK